MNCNVIHSLIHSQQLKNETPISTAGPAVQVSCKVHCQSWSLLSLETFQDLRRSQVIWGVPVRFGVSPRTSSGVAPMSADTKLA